MKDIILKKLMVCTMSFLFLSTSFANQTSQRQVQKHSFGLGLGQTFLLGNFDDKGENKITLDLLYSYSASFSFDLLVNVHNSHHTFSNREVRLRGITMAIKGRAYEFDAFSPYYLGGLGFYAPQVLENGLKSNRKFAFGFNFGAGIDLRLNDKYTVGLLAQYHNPFKVEQDNPAISDVKGSYFKLLMTLMHQF